MRQKQFRDWGRKGGASVTGEKKRRGDSDFYSKLGKQAALMKKWKGKLPAEYVPELPEGCKFDPLDRTFRPGVVY